MLIRHEAAESSVHIDFVPMADVLFNLLIFFLLATTIAQVEREINVALPQAAASGPITAGLREIVVNVTSDGGVVVGGKPVSDDELSNTIRTAVAANPGQKVNIRGDRATQYANVARVLGLCKQAGINEPFLETVPTN